MHDSTVFRDLGRYLEREAERFEELGYMEWASHLSRDARRLLGQAVRLGLSEPPLPSIESVAGSVDLTGGLSPEEHLRRLRGGDCSHDEELARLRTLRAATARYFAVLDRQQHAALGDGCDAIMAEVERATEGTIELAEAKRAVRSALSAAEPPQSPPSGEPCPPSQAGSGQAGPP